MKSPGREPNAFHSSIPDFYWSEPRHVGILALAVRYGFVISMIFWGTV